MKRGLSRDDLRRAHRRMRAGLCCVASARLLREAAAHTAQPELWTARPSSPCVCGRAVFASEKAETQRLLSWRSP